MAKILKVIKVILIVAAVVIVLIGISYAFNGSLEMHPTDEQQGKAGIASTLIIFFGLVVGAAGLLIKTK